MIRVLYFRLSGVDHTGDVAAALFAEAMKHGFDYIGTERDLWPHTSAASTDCRTARVNVSGVSASAQIAFDDDEQQITFFRDAPLREPSEPAATECFRALSAIVAGVPA